MPEVFRADRQCGKTYQTVQRVKADPAGVYVARSHEMARNVAEKYGLTDRQVVCVNSLESLRGHPTAVLYVDDYDLMSTEQMHELNSWKVAWLAMTDNSGVCRLLLLTDNHPEPRVMTQEAPYPEDLEWVIRNLNFQRDGWLFRLADVERDDGAARGLTLLVTVTTKDFYRDAPRHTRHEFIVPAATYNRSAWAQWVLGCIHLIDAHESAEAFVLNSERVFAPRHGPGFNPYDHVIYDATDEQRRTAP